MVKEKLIQNFSPLITLQTNPNLFLLVKVNPTSVHMLQLTISFQGVMVSTLDCESGHSGSNLGRGEYFIHIYLRVFFILIKLLYVWLRIHAYFSQMP